jgi:C4-dicarboxylate transporter DctQ subunit
MINFWEKIEKAINELTSLGAVIGGVFTAIMTMIVGYAVIVRYLINRPIGWSEEISIYFMIWAVFLGTAYTLKEDAHIGVDILISRVPEKTKRFFFLFHYIVGIVFLSILFYKGIGLVALSLKLNNRSIAIDFPLFIPHLAVPVGSAMLVLQFLLRLIRLSLKR